MIEFTSVPSNAIASATFIEQKFRKTGNPGPIPQRIAILAQYNSGKTPTNNVAVKVESPDDAASQAGLGSMLHRICQKLFGALGSSRVDIDWFPLGDGTGTSAGTITITASTVTAGVQSFYIAGKRVPVIIPAGTTQNAIAALIVAAINADTSLPVTAAAVDNIITLTAKWVGLSGNGITISQDLAAGESSQEPGGVTVAIVAMASGSADPSIETALSNFGDTFYTFVICPFNTDISLDLLETAGDARIDPSVKKPFIGVTGYVDTRANFLTALASRNSPWSTMVPIELGQNLPGEIAASVVGACAASAQIDPARPFKNLSLYDILPGTAAEWTSLQKDAIEEAGGSVTKNILGVVKIHDLVTTYTTNSEGAPDDSWRYTVTISNIQAKFYDLERVFTAEPFDRAFIVDDNSTTSKSYAIRPKTVKAYMSQLVDYWVENGWSKERDSIITSINAEIDTINPGRINLEVTDIITVGLRIMAIKYNWAFSAK